MKRVTYAVLTGLCLLFACSRGAKDADDAGNNLQPGLLDSAGDTAPQETDTAPDSHPCNPWYPCQDCGGSACSAELGDCVGSSTCQPALNTWAACVLDCGDPAVCAAQFAASGGAAAPPLRDCVQAACATECDL